MRAALLDAPESMRVADVPMPLCGADEIVMQVQACGMCGSDVKIFHHGNARVRFPAIIGHEIAGVIVEVGTEVSGFVAGDRVALSADVPCNACWYCAAGACNRCETNLAIGYQYPGGFAEYLKVDRRVWHQGPLHRIPENVSFPDAALAEPLACALNGMEALAPAERSSILIMGAGVLGCLFSELAPVFGYQQVFLVDTNEEKLALVRERGFRASDYFIFGDELRARVLDQTQGRGVDAVMVACPDPAAQRAALDLVAKGGAVNLFAGLAQASPPLSFSANLIHYRELMLTGSHGSTPAHHERALGLIASGRVAVNKLITHFFSLEEIDQALRVAMQVHRLKVMIQPHALSRYRAAVSA